MGLSICNLPLTKPAAMLKSLCAAALAASAAAFAPAKVGRTTVALNEMSKSIPFLEVPEKLDGSMVGDMGFDPMGLSDIQTDLRYARWAELKHGRVCMLAVLGMVWQEYLPHLPGDAYATRDPFEAITSVDSDQTSRPSLLSGSLSLLAGRRLSMGRAGLEFCQVGRARDGTKSLRRRRIGSIPVKLCTAVLP